jgi:hypothetical protein
MEKINSFDVLKRMSAENLDIRMAPNSNITLLKKVKAGTQVTIGVQGDVIAAIYTGELIGCFLLWNKKQFDETKAKMEEEGEKPK